MPRIYKYLVSVNDEFVVSMPSGAEILTVQVQHDSLYIWALVNPDKVPEARFFRIIATGHLIPDLEQLDYLATFQMQNGNFVGHLFERKEAVHA